MMSKNRKGRFVDSRGRYLKREQYESEFDIEELQELCNLKITDKKLQELLLLILIYLDCLDFDKRICLSCLTNIFKKLINYVPKFNDKILVERLNSYLDFKK